jgi:sterol desaturase/sphingolipid hydroxylase (fatty acid hydroxylase superfamily)
MHLNRIGYYSDFVVYPLVIAGLLTAARPTERGDVLVWLTNIALGLLLWAFLEYLLHRFVFHRLSLIRDMHEAHHKDATAPIGSPTWISLPLISLTVFLPLFQLVPLRMATGVAVGFVFGYLCYISVHHCIHRWNLRHGSYLYWMKRRHAVHHHRDDDANFGVTSPLWDLVFGTEFDRNSVDSRGSPRNAA